MNIIDDLFEALGLENEANNGVAALTELPVFEMYGENNGILVTKGSEPNTVIVGYLSHDPDAQEYFENNDNGELKTFRSESERDEFIGRMKRENKITFIVDRYEHSSVHYSVSDTKSYPDRRWDVAPSSVYVVPDDLAETFREKAKGKTKGARYNAARADLIVTANSVLDEYSKWCNGEVYGAVVETWTYDPERKVFTRDGSRDDCWGLIGDDHAKTYLQDMMQPLVPMPDVEAPRPSA